MAVAVVTDSASDLPAAWRAEQGVAMVPLTVWVDGREYRDQVDLDGAGFLRLLADSRELPRTAAPAPGAFAEAYRRLKEQGADGILSIHLSGALSATVRAAEAGRDLVPEAGPVAVVDGRSASLGTGLLVWWAAAGARAGRSLAALTAEVEALRRQMTALFVPRTLEYLARGGRIGHAARLVGGMLDMKPVLDLSEGSVRPVRKVRGWRQVPAALLAEAAARVPPGSAVLAAVGHVGDGGTAGLLAEGIRQRYQVLGLLAGEVGPVIGTHAGPGAVGCFLLALDAGQAAVWEEAAGA
ncbi:MAG: DegV family protein [Firmicutes bacterium]|nr:DegV family protein [Bacillota bacterium]